MILFFSPGHAGVLENERAEVLAGSSLDPGALIMNTPAVCAGAAVREMLAATRTFV